ncbi:MAG: Xaa-Pro peptidase family protein [Halobacteriales archaeon]|nr:Xaa-Pro peptidase family protein [Halobacteriales archaeon]
MPDDPPDRPYPAFSDAEYDRRSVRLRELMDELGLEAVLVYGDSGTYHHEQANVHYLANYLGHGAAYVAFFADPAAEPTLFFEISNHREFAEEVSVLDDVRWGGVPMAGTVADRVREAGAGAGRIGIVGRSLRDDRLIPYGHYRTFDDELRGELIDCTAAFERLRYVKSDEELDWIRRGGELTDRAIEAAVEAVEPGVTEHEVKAALEHAYVKEGGMLFISFLSSSSMEDPAPGECVPWHEASSRTIREGDVVTTELSASYFGYPGQVHRPIAVGRPPTAVYRDLFDTAKDAYENVVDALRPGNTARDVLAAAEPIVESEYHIDDPYLHGLATTLQPPFIGTEDSNYWPGHDDPVTENWVFEPNQTMVVQPNVVTADGRFGLQLGAAVIVTETGPEVVQDYPVEFVEV